MTTRMMAQTLVISRATQRHLLLARHSRQSSTLAAAASSYFFPAPVLLYTGSNPSYSVRWKRRDGNKAFDRQKPPTRKQRKAYNRKLKAAESSPQSAPGSKAGPRREFLQNFKDDLLSSSSSSSSSEEDATGTNAVDWTSYDIGDALLDDLIGNTAELSSQPTPQPVYLGDKAHKFYNRVADQLAEGQTPTDRDISLALRSYRDKQGTRRQPLGLIKALRFLLQDLQLPVTSFGEYTFTALLTCCQTPTEGRRVMQLQREQAREPCSYSWSILTDLHAKVGDFQGCRAVLDEMAQAGHPPTLAAYTSTIAACAQVCRDGGRVAHSIRAQAGEMGWKTWQEMRIVGIDPDVMAYGAMLRVCAARGHAERALNVLEEMEQMNVKPTSLCFSSALRAVARSHAIATRYERGSSKRHRRREFLTQHHGKLAIQIVRLAENAEVEQDDAFVSALILCAAAAGDVATAKAVFVASQVRQLDALRTIGTDEHLAQLRGEGEETKTLLVDGSSRALVDHQSSGPLAERVERKPQSFFEREYGKDSRVLSAILHASAVAASPQGMGLQWQGRENKGYLCENSLRLLMARRVPQYVDNQIPGEGRTDNLNWDGFNEDQQNYHKDLKSRQKKFRGVYEDENSAATLDELEETFSKMFVDKEGRLKEEFRKTTPDDIWKLKYGDEEDEDELALPASDSFVKLDAQEEPAAKMVFNPDKMQWETQKLPIPEEDEEEEEDQTSNKAATRSKQQESSEAPKEMYFDLDSRQWKEGRQPDVQKNDTKINNTAQAESRQESEAEDTELYFDANERRWKTRVKNQSKVHGKTSFEEEILGMNEDTLKSDDGDTDEGFELFFTELKAEVAEHGEEEVSEEEAQELYQLMKDEYNEVMSMDPNDLAELSTKAMQGQAQQDLKLPGDGGSSDEIVKTSTQVGSMQPSPSALGPTPSGGGELSQGTAARTTTSTATVEMDEAFWSQVTGELKMDLGESIEGSISHEVEEISETDLLQSDFQLGLLREVLPTFSDTRLVRIQRAFHASLREPSILELIPLVRERMPDYLTNTWLKQMSALTSRFVIHKAAQEGLVDMHMLNGVLELEAASGSLERAVEFYETKYAENGLAPNGYTDRMMIQMFLKNNRFSRALAFKQKVESNGRVADLSSYGSFIDFCSRRDQMGSALMLLKECAAVHGATPGEASLTQLRALCRRTNMTDEVGLTDLIGEDPVQWLKHGEAHLKREYSKKGRRNVLLARNRVVHV